MAKNMKLPNALHIELPVPSGTVAGDIVAAGAFRGIAQTDRDADGTATVWLDGSAEVSVDGAIATVGLPVYISGNGTSLRATSAIVVKDNGATPPVPNTLIGYSLGTKAAAIGPLEVALLNGPAQV